MRLSAAAAVAVLVATGLSAAPAQAASPKVAYGWAWPDGKGKLRIVPRAAKLYTAYNGIKTYRLKAVAGAKEMRLDYSSASFYRISSTCAARDIGGKFAVSAKGLGTTKCAPRDLAFVFDLGPTPVRVVYNGTKAVGIHQFWAGPATERPITAFGMLRYRGDGTPGPSISGIVTFTPEGGRPMTLRYDEWAGFHRIAAACGSDWLSAPLDAADKDGLGSYACGARHITAVFKRLKQPVYVKLKYTPLAGLMSEVWEVSRD
ncbi:hypothetical protein [Herbidospora daliensis]|uniref:hypothetical protein n=1 Tax=Herbidospora daliensis TaxID=295585 RepID=UPI000A543DFA|nr:hypothetical protein [Herbidospora daliensis]